jgi:hypothetical protein
VQEAVEPIGSLEANEELVGVVRRKLAVIVRGGGGDARQVR